MKRFIFTTRLILITLLLSLFGGCSDQEIDIEQPTDSNQRICKMELIGSVISFDQTKDSNTARETKSSWKNDDKIYLTFYNGSNIVSGLGTYNVTAGWTLSYDGSLALGNNLKCEARFFENATAANSYLVTINPNTEIYEDMNATYTFNNNVLTVQASLVPKTGRIRFTGTSDAEINLTGITTYSTFAPGINQFTTSKAMIPSTVLSNGSTPYIYGYFSNSDRYISIIGSDFAFTRTCSSEMLKTGDSGYMAIPSETSHNNWRTGAIIKVGDNEIKMIPVAGLSSGFFLIAETETTVAFYNTVNGIPSESVLPVCNIYYSSITSFVEKLNNDTKLQFSLPSLEQWQYAAKGGNQSLGYTYAGSNTPGDVAWYKANSTTVQNVKTKTPNELGIYDMSGNVAEWTSTSANYYEERYICGGSLNHASSLITSMSTEKLHTSYTRTYIGFRLILTCP